MDISAPDNPTHHAVVERRNKIMGKFIDVALSKGDLNTIDDLQMYCAAASTACNLQHICNGHTVLKYLTGEIPRTHRDTVVYSDIPTILQQLDTDFLRQLKSLLTEANDLVHIPRDDDARYSAMVRDANAERQVLTQFDLRIGDEVSYNGDKYELLELSPLAPSGPAKAVFRAVTHDTETTRTVLCSELRPLASPHPEHLFTTLTDSDAPTTLSIGTFVFFKVLSTHNSNSCRDDHSHA